MLEDPSRYSGPIEMHTDDADVIDANRLVSVADSLDLLDTK
jgi:hypothetical protein